MRWRTGYKEELTLVAEVLPADGGSQDRAEASPLAAGEAADAAEGEDEDTLLRYPGGGYWGLPPGARLRMLLQLCCDALATGALRREPFSRALCSFAGQ
jgi:hypothetical protein